MSKSSDTSSYIRIGTKYYKKTYTDTELASIEYKYIPWTKNTIKDDYPKDTFPGFISAIPKYDGICYEPSFFDQYKPIVQFKNTTRLNDFKPLSYTPSQGNFKTIEKFILHIFGETESSLEMPKLGSPLTIFIDLMSITFQHPKQRKFVLGLLSKTQKTGKNEFLDLLTAIFEDNTKPMESHLDHGIHHSYLPSLLTLYDEVKFSADEKTIVKEKIKNLLTSREIPVKPHGIRYTIDNYTWLVWASNRIEDFIGLENEGIKFWLVDMPEMEESKFNPNFLSDMKQEIPAFVSYLMKREITHPNDGIFWIGTKHIAKDAFCRIVESTKTVFTQKIEQFLKSCFLKTLTEGELPVHGFRISAATIADQVNKRNSKDKYVLTSLQVQKYLKEQLNLPSTKNRPGSYPSMKTPLPGEEKYRSVEREWNPSNGSTYYISSSQLLSRRDFPSEEDFDNFFEKGICKGII